MKNWIIPLIAGLITLAIANRTNAQGLSIGSGTTFSLGSATLTLPGSWTNAGTFTPGTGTVVFSGSGSDQNITNASGETFYKLTINSGAKVVIGPGQTVSVTNTLANNGGSEGLLIDSDASGTGKLVNNTAGVEGIMGQYLVKDQWHYMGIPFAETDTAGFYFKGFYVAQSDESTAEDGTATGWEYLTASDNIAAGIGYAVYYTPNDTMQYISGTFNTRDQTVTTAYTSADRGWNLISNPYPCTVTWDEIDDHLTNVNNAIYVYNPLGGTYGTWNGTTGTNGQDQYIAPLQAFFVRGNIGAGSVTFTNGAKTATASSFKSETIQTVIRLAANDNEGHSDESVICVRDDATNMFDRQLDAYKLKEKTSQTPQIYSVFNGNDYSINSIPVITETTLIPLQILTKQDGGHTISLVEINSYGYAYPLILYNPESGEMAFLEDDDYRFNAKAGETTLLQLIFSNDLTGIEKTGLDAICIKLAGRQLQVSGLGSGKSTIWVSNVTGQIISKGTAFGDSYMQDNLPPGVLLVRAQKDDGTCKVTKVMAR